MTREDLIDTLNSVVTGCLEGEPFDLQAYLTSGDPLPLDSMGYFELGVRLEDTFQLSLTDEQLVGIKDAGNLWTLVTAHVGFQPQPAAP